MNLISTFCQGHIFEQKTYFFCISRKKIVPLRAIMDFTHLHVHSHYSVLDGMSKVPDLVDKCLKTGMDAIALTDHGNMCGVKELLDYCKKLDKPFKPIAGVEAYCARRGRHSQTSEEAINGEGRKYIIDRSGWHLILLAKNKQGYRNLCKLVSYSYMDDAFNYHPRIDKELLEQYHEGIICSSACLGGEIPQRILNGDLEGAEESVKWFKNLFGDDYYIEIQRHQTQKPGGEQSTYQQQLKVNPVLIELARKHNIKIIATNDAHFLNEENAEAHDHLICVSTNHYIDDVDRMHYTKQEWLKTPEEMEAIFSDLPEALTNTREIVDKVEVYDIDSDPLMPMFPIPEEFGTEQQYHDKFTEEQLFNEFTCNEHGEVVMDETAAKKKILKLGGYDRLYRIKLEADYLRFLTMKGAVERYGQERVDNDDELKERIDFELHTMKTMGFPGYFLIVMDFIRGAREELGVSVGPGRGSAAGSVVAYCLHITDLDPLKYDLLFERFLNPDRISLPDIDTDFDDEGRAKVIEWVSNKYGKTHVAHIITYGVMAAKSAIADIGRVERIPLAKVNEIKSYIPDRGFPDNIKDEKGKSPKVNLRNCYRYVDELRAMVNGDEPEIKTMLDYAAQLEGTIRQVGIHACGVIIGADDLTNFCPLSSVFDKETNSRVLVTEYDGHVVESIGLIKMDFLGLKTLSIIRECVRNIKAARNIDVDIDHIPIDDELTYKLFQDGKTIAVFQFESAGMQKYLKDLKPTVIGDLIAMNALYRPGPMQYIPQFIRRKQGLEPVTYDIPVMEKYLSDTYGVTVYQEQVMLLSRLLAGFTRGESDKLRKAMGKKQMAILQELKGKFMAGGKANGHNEQILEKIWKDWENFASYAFNKSHAACYSWVAYQTGYLKAHYPAEFMAANLTISKDDIKEVTKFMDECKALKIPVLGPDVNESELNFTVNTHGDIRFGLGGIKGVGEAAVQAIIQERHNNGKYRDIYDFLERVNLQSCNRKTFENLAMAGAFDSFDGFYREQVRAYNERGENMLEVLINYGNTYQQDKSNNQNTLFGDFSDFTNVIAKPELPPAPRMTMIERLNIEKDLIGIYLSAHPLDDYEMEIRELCEISTTDLNWLDAHRREIEVQRRDGTKSTRRRLALRDWKGVSETVNDTTFSVEEQFTRYLDRLYEQPVHFGGIITKAEERTGRTGTPFGMYTIEDYHGAYSFTLFGQTYRSFAPVLKPNVYVYITACLTQAGKGQTWFREKPREEAEYELQFQKVELLEQVQRNYLKALELNIPLQHLEPAFGEDLKARLVANDANDLKQRVAAAALRFAVMDEDNHNRIEFTSQTYRVHIDANFYRWLLQIENDYHITHTLIHI